jgi:hypothetical protein
MFVLEAEDDSSFLACSAASRRRCMAILSLARSTPVAFLTVVSRWLDDALVPVVATEVVVAAGGLDLDRREAVVGVLAHLEEGHVEGATAEVEDEDESSSLPLSRP